MIVIVTGSRIWPTFLTIWQVLDAYAPTLVVHGGADGADGMAESWCKGRQVDSHAVRAKWGQRPDIDYGAGHARNRRMLELYPGALVVAFPHGKAAGTRGCMAQAERLGHPLKVFDVDGRLIAAGR